MEMALDYHTLLLKCLLSVEALHHETIGNGLKTVNVKTFLKFKSIICIFYF